MIHCYIDCLIIIIIIIIIIVVVVIIIIIITIIIIIILIAKSSAFFTSVLLAKLFTASIVFASKLSFLIVEVSDFQLPYFLCYNQSF